MVFHAPQSVLLQYLIMVRYSIGEDIKNEKYVLNFPQINYDKITGSLWRFDIYTQPFITGIVKECSTFEMCLVGNIGLKSLSMGVNMT